MTTSCDIDGCKISAFVKVTYPNENSNILCKDHFETDDPNVGKIYQKDNPEIELLI